MFIARIGAVFFMLWGLLHILGGGLVLLAVGESPDAGFAVYDPSASGYTPLAGSVLAYLAFGFAWLGALVTGVAVLSNWQNSERGLLLNTTLVGFTDLGLVFYLVLPGHLSWFDALPGLLLFAGGAVFGGIACRTAGGDGADAFAAP